MHSPTLPPPLTAPTLASPLPLDKFSFRSQSSSFSANEGCCCCCCWALLLGEVNLLIRSLRFSFLVLPPPALAPLPSLLPPLVTMMESVSLAVRLPLLPPLLLLLISASRLQFIMLSSRSSRSKLGIEGKILFVINV